MASREMERRVEYSFNTGMRQWGDQVRVQYGNRLTRGLAEIRVYAPVLTPFLAEGFRLPAYAAFPP